MIHYAVVREADSAFVPQAVRLHYDALSYRSFITSFGLGFLERLYRGLLARGIGFLVVAHDGDQLRGFILACEDSGRMMSVIARRPWAFAPVMLPTLVRHPSLLGKLFQTLFYARKEATDVKPELVVIAVADGMRSRGVGAELVKALEAELARIGVARYKVTVHAVMEDSNRFYRKTGFALGNTFELYGVTWNLYVRDIA